MDPELAATFRHLMDRIESTPEGALRLPYVEEIISLADEHGQDELAFLFRKESMMTYYTARRADLILVHFARCVAYAHQHPESHLENILWQYRWVIDMMPSLLNISVRQIDQTWHEMVTSYERAGRSLRPVWLLRRRLAMEFGDYALATEADQAYRKAKRDDLADSLETEAAFDVDYGRFLDDDVMLGKLAVPFFSGKYDSMHFMTSVVHKCLRMLARTGQTDVANHWIKQCRKYITDTPKMAGTPYNHVEYLTVTGKLEAAVRDFDRHFIAAMDHPGRLSHFEFLLSGWLLTRRLIAEQRGDITLSAPVGYVPNTTGTRVMARDLAPRIEADIRELATLADARHGNGYYTKRLSEIAELEALAKRYTPG
ncbi:MAG: hypothetical protein ACRC8S_10810 [Fimbriiglobus sp.]